MVCASATLLLWRILQFQRILKTSLIPFEQSVIIWRKNSIETWQLNACLTLKNAKFVLKIMLMREWSNKDKNYSMYGYISYGQI